MRIAYLINQYPNVGLSYIRREIAALERQGFDVMRVALRGWEGKQENADDRAELERTHYVLRNGTLPLVWAALRMLLTRPGRLLEALKTAWRLSRHAQRPFPVHLVYVAEACCIEPWLRKEGVKHLHAHFGTNSAEVAMLTHILGGPRWSFTVHGPEEFDKRQFVGLGDKVAHCTFVAAISSYGRSQLYRFSEYEHWPKVQVVHCGIEPEFHSVKTASPPAARRLVCIGRLCVQKGQMLLVEAARRLVAEGSNLEVVLVGDGEMRADIEALIARHDLQNTVRITGWIGSDQVRDEILAARALVLPSFAEGLPVVIMEAMTLRRPIISTYIAGIPELVRPGEHGWLVPAGNIEALVEAMRACLDAPVETLARMGEAARERVLARHDIDVEAAKLAALFRA